MKTENSQNIPKTFIRVWIGKKEIPEIFEQWWQELKDMHKDYNFITLNEDSIKKLLIIPSEIEEILKITTSCAGYSDIIRLLALDQIGGVYVDTDIMPLKPFDDLILSNQPFLGKRSGKSFETAVIGSPKGHEAIKDVIKNLPKWFYDHIDRSASVQTGPAFVSSVLFGRNDVTHLPIKTFYPFNGFGAPKRNEKNEIFKEKYKFPEEMICAHFSNHIWGGNPNKK